MCASLSLGVGEPSGTWKIPPVAVVDGLGGWLFSLTGKTASSIVFYSGRPSRLSCSLIPSGTFSGWLGGAFCSRSPGNSVICLARALCSGRPIRLSCSLVPTGTFSLVMRYPVLLRAWSVALRSRNPDVRSGRAVARR